MKSKTALVLTAGLAVALALAGHGLQGVAQNAPRKVIIFVWDGLRPDSVNAKDTPNLFALRQRGVNFTDNHATYPTFTMMNAASIATGSFPGTTGFYGNTLWAPGAKGQDSSKTTLDFQQPVFTEDYAVLDALDAYYQNDLLLVGTLFQAAQKAGLKTAAVGKTGAAFLQDRKRGGILLDEKSAQPLAFAQELQAGGFKLPALSANAFPAGALTLAADNGTPTAASPVKRLADNSASDPTDASGSPSALANEYMMNVYLEDILPKHNPDLSLVWLRNPDSTEHPYGPNTANVIAALNSQDKMLGQLQAKLSALGMSANTDLIVVSDHGHSSVAGDVSVFPLRAVTNGQVGGLDAKGYSVSGDVRTADLLTRAGFRAFDGGGCTLDSVLSGVLADGSTVYPTQTDADGAICGKAGQKYTTASFKVPTTLQPGDVIVAANGGSDYLYVPDHDPAVVNRLARFLQARPQYGAVFTASRYGNIPGAIPLTAIRVESPSGRNPDLIVSFAWNATANVAGLPGTEYESMQGNRGMHGSFSPIDVHNTLAALGPDFKAGFSDGLPSGNVDVAPTVAALLGVSLPQADGRVLREAQVNGIDASSVKVTRAIQHSTTPATGLSMLKVTDLNGKDVVATRGLYTVDLRTKTLTQDAKTYTYFDLAEGRRF